MDLFDDLPSSIEDIIETIKEITTNDVDEDEILDVFAENRVNNNRFPLEAATFHVVTNMFEEAVKEYIEGYQTDIAEEIMNNLNYNNGLAKEIFKALNDSGISIPDEYEQDFIEDNIELIKKIVEKALESNEQQIQEDLLSYDDNNYETFFNYLDSRIYFLGNSFPDYETFKDSITEHLLDKNKDFLQEIYSLALEQSKEFNRGYELVEKVDEKLKEENKKNIKGKSHEFV